MLVRDLIARTTWKPGADYGKGPKPTVSVLMPTYRRGADGLFERAVRSVLAQSLPALELIVVDDASTDGTAQVAERLMAEDGRVSVLRHPDNIGLPAISEYEAYVRARGDYFAFAFDDFIFQPNAIEHLVAQARAHPQDVVHGYVSWTDSVGVERMLGKDPVPHELLMYYNFLGNSSFLLRRSDIEEVGLYDPHVATSRLCDWHLWRRVLRTRFLKRVDVHVGHEYGASRQDSLGNTHPVHAEVVHELFEAKGDEPLRPANLPDYDVWKLPAESSAPLAMAVFSSRMFFARKGWAQGLSPLPAQDVAVLARPTKPVLGVVASLDASLSMFFEPFAHEIGSAVKFIDAFAAKPFVTLSIRNCDCVVFVRSLLVPQIAELVDQCVQDRIDHYYFNDDNFQILAPEIVEVQQYTDDQVRERLKSFTGVLVGSAALKDYFERRQLHANVSVLTVAASRQKRDRLKRLHRPATTALRFGFAGNQSRNASLLLEIVPALEALAASRPIELCVPRGAVPPTAVRRVRIVEVDRVSYFDDFLRQWYELGIDVLIHPPAGTANARYKNQHILVTAWYLGAVPVVGEEDVFADVGDADGVATVTAAERWHAVLARLADPATREGYLARLEATIARRFNPEKNFATLRDLVRRQRNVVDLFESMREKAVSAEGPVAKLRTARRQIKRLKAKLAAADDGNPGTGRSKPSVPAKVVREIRRVLDWYALRGRKLPDVDPSDP